MATEELAEIALHYSQTHGLVYKWEQNVNLSPPKSWTAEPPTGDRFVLDYYNALQYALYETGNPETVDRTFRPREANNPSQVNAVYLSSPVECLGIILEGGRQLPDGFHLVLSPSWLRKTPSEEDPSLCSLWLHKSISIHANGTTYIDEFAPPRRVTYFCNYFTVNCTSGQRNDGIEVERDLDCPMSSSMKLSHYVDDKVYTRDIMSSVGMAVPETIAFRRKNVRKLMASKGRIMTVDFESYETLDKLMMQNEISMLCKRLYNRNVEKIVTKPSGPMYLGSVGVSFHSVTDVASVINAADELLVEIPEGSSVLVEEFIEPMNVEINVENVDAPLWMADEYLGFRCRATICRDHDNTPVTTLINCNVGDKNFPINGDNGMCQTLDTTLQAYGIADENVRRQLEYDVRVQASDVLSGIIERENKIPLEARGGRRAQTDVIGIDMIITKREGRLVPVGVEVNSHDCTINTHIFDFTMQTGRTMLPQQYGRNVHVCANPPTGPPEYLDDEELSGPIMDAPQDMDVEMENGERDIDTTITMSNKMGGSLGVTPPVENGMPGCSANTLSFRKRQRQRLRLLESRYFSGEVVGMSVRPLIRNVITRSQRFLMEGKRILFVGAGGVSKAKIWPDTAAYGINVILVESDPEHFAKDQVHTFIHYDLHNHKLDEAHAANIVNKLMTLGLRVDGCMTIWEDCVPLAALINELLGTRGLSHWAAQNAKMKSRTQAALQARDGDIPQWPRTVLYTGKTFHIGTQDDIASISERMHFPAILKLEHGSSAVGVTIVNNKEEMFDKYEHIATTLRRESDFPGIGLGHDNSMLAMEFHGGSEHDIDIVIFERKIVAAFISDNGPTNYPSFTETAALMPSSLPLDKQSQLIVAAYQCCTEIGLSDGVFNVEMKMTEVGPKLIEINARMGGFYLRDWILRVYGVDLLLCGLMTAANLRPFVPKIPAAEQLMGIMVVPSSHHHLLDNRDYAARLAALVNSGEVVYSDMGDPEEMMPGEFEEPFGHLTISSNSPFEAKRRLINICRHLNIDKNDYQVTRFLQKL